MEVLKFKYPLLLHGLWGVFLLVLFFVYVFRHKEALLRRFGQIELVRKMMPGYSRVRAIWKSGLFILAYVFFVIAAANPQLGTHLEEVKRKGVDIIVALDLSLSMQAEDIAPNRLQKAKHEVSKLIDLLDGDRIGLIGFAGLAHTHSPLTLDYGAAKLFLRMMDTNLIPQKGTAIGHAIDEAIQAFEKTERKYKVLILITDGEDHGTKPIEMAEKAAEEGIKIHTIGLGSPKGVPIPIYDKYGNQTGFKKDRQGNVVTTKLDQNTLQKIAFVTDGKYYLSSSGETELGKILEQINAMEQKELSAKKFTQYEDRYQIFIILGLLALIIEWFLPIRTRKYKDEMVYS
ncbi:MAG: VWA domain-containing protein [Caldithrix sp.]|nr:VWA domain-containing protein [Caldithrix sp.]